MRSPPLTAERAAHGPECDRGQDGIARLSSLCGRLAELPQIDGLSETTFHRWPVGPVHVDASHVVERASLDSEMLALDLHREMELSGRWRDSGVAAYGTS
jgi:hypothetical protein